MKPNEGWEYMKEGGFSKSLPMLKFLKDVYFFFKYMVNALYRKDNYI